MNGILLINKPQEFTSFDVVAVCRRLCGTKKIGHTGTLDPMATGVLVLMTGSSTKALSHIPDKSKTYKAKFIPGIVTETGDIWGQVISQRQCSISIEQVERLLPDFRGEIMQTPPMYSAVKIGGKRLYQLAREGKTVERQQRRVTVNRLELIGQDAATKEFELLIECSAGTYIRSIITDLGELLGCGATMSALCRTSACGFDISQTVDIDEAKALAEQNALQSRIIPLDRAFDMYGALTLGSKERFRFLNGAAFNAPKEASSGQIYRLYDCDGLFLGLGRETDGAIKTVYLDIRG